jgi:hypothetical protein
LHVVPELRASLVNLEKPTFEDDAKEEAAMCARHSFLLCFFCNSLYRYKRSLEVRSRPLRVLHLRVYLVHVQ